MAQEILLTALFGMGSSLNLEAGLKLLPEDFQKRIQEALHGEKISLQEVLFDPMRALSSVHPSWYQEVVSFSPKPLQSSLNALLSNQPTEKRTPVEEFLLHYALQRWPDRNRPSIETLQDHPLSWILRLDAAQIEEIINLLAMHEIVESMRKIVDKKQMHKVLSILSSLQQKYLRFLLQRKGENLPAKITCQELIQLSTQEARNLLFQHGLDQLATLLSNQDDLFYWHLFHHLDKDYALNLKAHILKAQDSPDRKVFEKRIAGICQFLRGSKEA